MLVLLLELLQSGDLPELAVGGAWSVVQDLFVRASAPLGPVALKADIRQCFEAITASYVVECMTRLAEDAKERFRKPVYLAVPSGRRAEAELA